MPDRKVLLIEDDPDVRLGLAVRLKANHFDVFCAQDANSGWCAAQQHRPDVIILDLGLPGDNGYVVLHKLAASRQLAAIPVIVLSACDKKVHEPKVRKAGARVFCQKPIDHEELLARIRQIFAATVKKPAVRHPAAPKPAVKGGHHAG